MTDKILITVEDAVIRVKMNHPRKKNALLPEMYIALNEAFDRLNDDNAIRALLLEGTEDVFTAGNDMSSFLSVQDQDQSQDNPTLALMKKAATCQKPLIAAVNGPAVGIGTSLLFSFDLVYASDTAYFMTPFVNLAIVPEAGTTMLMPHIIGWQAAAEMLLTGDKIDAKRAYDMGFVNKVVPAAELETTALTMAKKVAAKPASSIRLTKQLMKGDQTALLDIIDQEMRILADCTKSPEMQEAVSAFLQKRAPDFSQFD